MENVTIADNSRQELLKAKMIINQFITSCSHTMRGPLKSIEGLVNLLNTGKNYSENEAKVCLELIQSTVLKLEGTLDELEHLLENSRQVVQQKEVYFIKLLQLVLVPFKPEIEQAGVHIEFCIEQTIPFYTDVARLRLILSHLLANAIQFRDDAKAVKEIHISIKTTSTTSTIAISDNGIGIESANQEEIFGLFCRASEKSKGAGVGLYVVQDMLTKMNGSISVDAVPHKGSVFTISVPNLQVE